MRHRFVFPFLKGFLLVFASLPLLHGSAFCADRNAFVFTGYDLNASVTPATQSLAVKGKVILRNDTEAPQTRPVLQISSTLEWEKITLEGGGQVQWISQPYASDVDHTASLNEATVTLPEAAAPGSTVTLNIEYKGTVPTSTKRLTEIGTPEDQALRSDWDMISEHSTAVRGLGYVVWYPVATEAARLSESNAMFSEVARWRQRHATTPMRVNFCHMGAGATSDDIQTNGKTIAGQTKPGCKTIEFNLANIGVPTFVIDKFQKLERPSITIYHSAAETQQARDYALEFERQQPFVESILGPAKGKAELIQLTGVNATPYESGATLFSPLPGAERLELDIPIAYQLSHICLDSKRPWISEGVAHLMQGIVIENVNGRRNAIRYVSQFGSALAHVDRPAPAASGEKTASAGSNQPLVTTNDELFYRAKAFYVWWMLRDMIGEGALSSALMAYRAEEDKEPSYIQRLIESKTAPKRDLEWFFDDWVYRDKGLPDFRIVTAYPRKLLNGAWVVAVTVENKGAAGAEVPLRARASQGERSTRVLVKGGEQAFVRLELPGTPIELTVNDGSVPESDTTNNVFKVTVQ